jgi:phenylacetic acid degradation protein paaN
MIEAALAAFHARGFYAQYLEMPSPKVYGETAEADGKARWEALLGQPFAMKQSSTVMLVSDEQSAFTRQPLGISYPAFAEPKQAVDAAQATLAAWRDAGPRTRAGILTEAIERMKDRFFDVAFATMHGTGQGFMMAFQASGPHAADRALEAIALGLAEQTRYPDEVIWDKPAGKTNLVLKKYFKPVPKGVALAVACSTFPVWNSLPGIVASLVTGNPVVVKPHPLGIASLAIVVGLIQDVLVENGFSADVCVLAPDTAAKPITKELAQDSRVKIIDYTGSTSFGDWLEALPGKQTFTEKAGVNSIILDSMADLNAVAQNLAMSVALYSGQMCTKPQNIFIPKSGVTAAGANVPYADVVKALTEAITGLATHPKAGPAVLGAIQSDATASRVAQLKTSGLKLLLEPTPISNPEFPDARLNVPAVVEANAADPATFSTERFGPIAVVIPTDSTEHSIRLAQQMALEHGAISCGAYTTDAAVMEHIAEAMSVAATPVAFNLTGQTFLNQNAGYSDFHVSGGNPAGNATLSNPEYLLRRFTMLGFKVNES